MAKFKVQGSLVEFDDDKAAVRVWRADALATPAFHIHASVTIGNDELHAPLSELLSDGEQKQLERLLHSAQAALLKRAGLQAEPEAAEPDDKK